MSLLGALYGRAAGARRAWYRGRPDRARRLEQAVISIGNVAAGGSGKTPLVAALVRTLLAAGERPSILSRGYARRLASDGVVVVTDGERILSTPQASGDEPYMLARAMAGVPVLVCADRYLAGRLAEKRFGCSVHVLDDGFQHLQLAREVDVVVMSPADLEEPLLPSGRLREPVGAARAADALVVPGSDDDVRRVADAAGVKRAFRLEQRFDRPRLVESPDVALDTGNSRRIVSVAGIARPERLASVLRELGWDVAGSFTFPDHHWFSARDLERVERAAAESGAAAVITTEKDAVRLPARARADETVPWAFLPLTVAVHPAGEFRAWLLERLAAARAAPREGGRTVGRHSPMTRGAAS